MNSTCRQAFGILTRLKILKLARYRTIRTKNIEYTSEFVFWIRSCSCLFVLSYCNYIYTFRFVKGTINVKTTSWYLFLNVCDFTFNHLLYLFCLNYLIPEKSRTNTLKFMIGNWADSRIVMYMIDRFFYVDMDYCFNSG